jgi:hypothetical protein
MRSRKSLLALVAIAVLIGIAFSLREHSQPQQESEIADTAARRTSLRDQAQPPQPDEGRARASAAVEPRQPVGGAPHSESAERAGRQDRAPQLTVEQSQAMVLDAYAGEAVDSAWSAQTSYKLDAAVRGHLPAGSKLSSLECRTSMCQLKVTHPDPMAHSTFMMDGFGSWPGWVLVAGKEQDRGEVVITLIVGREGTALPLGPR